MSSISSIIARLSSVIAASQIAGAPRNNDQAVQEVAVEGIPRGLFAQIQPSLDRWTFTRASNSLFQEKMAVSQRIESYCQDPSSKTLDFSDLKELSSLPKKIRELPEIEEIHLHKDVIPTLTYWAIEEGLEMVEWLFAHAGKAILDHPWEKQQYTPLMYGYLHAKKKEVCDFLIRQEGSLRMNTFGEAPLSWAIGNNQNWSLTPPERREAIIQHIKDHFETLSKE